MITDINSEDRLVQKTFADHLHDRLGWDSVYAWNEETSGINGPPATRQHAQPFPQLLAPCFRRGW